MLADGIDIDGRPRGWTLFSCQQAIAAGLSCAFSVKARIIFNKVAIENIAFKIDAMQLQLICLIYLALKQKKWLW